MLARIRKATEEKDQGFTLIELLVVMIIIGILAAIAIPVFLNQRQNGWRSQVQSDLRNAATAVESAAVSNGGSYAFIADAANLETGTFDPAIEFRASADVTVLAGTAGTAQAFCLEATHTSLGAAEVWSYSKAGGVPVEGACT